VTSTAAIGKPIRRGLDVPLIVLSALAPDPGQGLVLSEQRRRTLTDRKRAFYAAVAEAVPRGEHRVLEAWRHSRRPGLRS
jgi:hypothetical protein